MPSVCITKQINAPIEDVFDHATNLRSAAQHITAIKQMDVLTEGPIRVGTRFRETRIMFGREATEEMEITVLDRPHRWALDCENHGCRYHTEFRLTPNENGTNVALTFEATPLTTFAKIMVFLMRPLLKHCANACQQDLDDLERAITANQKDG